MSPLPTRMTLKKEVVLNSVAEFLGIWAVRGEASLSLNTKDGVTTIAFTHSLSGHPEDPLHPPAKTGNSPQRRRRHRGPARRERDRQRAARHQATQLGQAGASPASPGRAGASPASPPLVAIFQCDQCEKTFKTEPGLKIHTGKAHKKGDSTPPPPDRLRQHPGSPATLPSSPFLDASREEVAEVVMVEPTPPRLPSSSRTFSEESDTDVQDTCKECKEEFTIPAGLCCDKTRHLCEECCYEHKDCKVFLSEERARRKQAGLDIEVASKM